MPFSLSRRDLLRSLGLLPLGLLATSEASAATTGQALRFPSSAYAPWIRVENAQTGDPHWMSGPAAPGGILEGYTNATSVNRGSTLSFYVSCTTSTLNVKVYRMGYYQGTGARLVEQRLHVPARVQAVPTPDQYGTVDCQWNETFQLNVDARYLPGQYLARIENARHQYRFIPFVVRDDASTATFVYMSAVTTWQAYNTWGGFSLYRQATSDGDTIVSNAARAVRVSFNRPYDRNFANGAGDFIGNEFPLLYLCESLGLDLTYWTDVDLHVRGHLLSAHRALLSLGHDEYYSPAMRNAVTSAVAQGVNVAFFGANFCYRKIRFETGTNGDNRLMVNYRSTADPITATNPSAATVNWASSPSDTPESTFTGSIYGGVDGTGSLHVVDANGWLWRGTGLNDSSVLLNALGGEFNHYNPSGVNPSNVQIVAHSPVGGGVSDATYVAQPGQGGVFTSGTGHWIYSLSNTPLLGNRWIPAPLPGVTGPLSVATKNILALFSGGPAGTIAPSRDNTAQFYG